MFRERDNKGKFIKSSIPSTFDAKKYLNEYNRRNKEKRTRQSVEWGRKNKDKRKIIKDRWRAKNKERTNFLSRLYHYRKKHAVGNVTFEQIKYLYSRFSSCAYCGKNKPNTIDHVIPLSKGGTNNIDNLIPVCVNCNSKKGNKSLIEWNPMAFYNLYSLTRHHEY